MYISTISSQNITRLRVVLPTLMMMVSQCKDVALHFHLKSPKLRNVQQRVRARICVGDCHGEVVLHFDAWETIFTLDSCFPSTHFPGSSHIGGLPKVSDISTKTVELWESTTSSVDGLSLVEDVAPYMEKVSQYCTS